MKTTPAICLAFASLQSLAVALTVAEINGNKFISPYSGQAVTNVTGLLIAKGPSGIWIRSTTPDDDKATSEAVYVFGNKVGTNLTVGDIITLDGKVSEYRSSEAYIYLTEITSPKNVQVISSGNTVTPLVIGKDTLPPPTVQYTSLDNGDIYGLPNAVSNISEVNPVLDPTKYGLDFWESLSGELVTIKAPKAIKTPNKYGDTWVVGDWAVTGKNKHGGLTMSDKDSNPEAIIIGAPLDGTKNPTTSKMNDAFADITGVLTQTFGFYTSSSRFSPLGSYNVENLSPTSPHLPLIAAHIVTYLKTPDLLFLQEIQDDSGPTDNDNITSAATTLTTLISAIASLPGGTTYSFATVDPTPNTDGGQPGGNIRQAYLYRPSRALAFIAKILELDPNANVIAAGDFNEFAFVGPMKTFSKLSKMVDLDEAAKIPIEERYTYAYDMNAQALDHMYVSPALAQDKATRFEHIHVNSWAAFDDVVSDHDPSIALMDVCGR
ncbi:hypothetical protein N0V88_007272 [Collariella sp. IMI 366227]|nr:hypothetical protein N0V88_007272 [Collariella sp. IMI 366227]